MSEVDTLQGAPEGMTSEFLPQNRLETDQPKTLMEWHELDCRKFIEGQKKDGVADEDLITMEEVVAICKEVRAEIYAEEQALANNS
ncbi:MAG: hypothetical protein FWE67_09360 [Planctomycetaceae bacterium]|nr:hypothetical protein [Planctomycetaceae bacterium]